MLQVYCLSQVIVFRPDREVSYRSIPEANV